MNREVDSVFESLTITLDGHFPDSHGIPSKYIFLNDRYPFNTWQVGDYVEIDLDNISKYKSVLDFKDTSVIRKFGSSNEIVSRSSNNIPSISRNESRGIIGVLNEAIDSDERNEYESTRWF